ncbi:MAG: hypothetical protein QM711_15465 [Micropruina sp.]|uniref:hypothetical protein n=1 Tax=Micropruina sp. TaxID=2737536 RepID=UPI0039E4D053
MNRDDSADTRFEDLMAREFPAGLGGTDEPDASADTEPDPGPGVDEPAPAGAAAPPSAEPSGDFRSWVPPDEPDEQFVPPPAPPPGRWTPAGIAGTVLVALPLALVLVSAVGVRLPMLVSVLSWLGCFVGAGLLLHRLRRRPPVDGDGAVV